MEVKEINNETLGQFVGWAVSFGYQGRSYRALVTEIDYLGTERQGYLHIKFGRVFNWASNAWREVNNMPRFSVGLTEVRFAEPQGPYFMLQGNASHDPLYFVFVRELTLDPPS